jgi:hypothetical protein
MEAVFMLVGVSVTIVLAVLLLLAINFVAGLGEAKKDYYDSLERLRQEPKNLDLQGKVAIFGRQYASQLRTVWLGWLFNEATVKNAIKAALAEAKSKVPTDIDGPRPSAKQRKERRTVDPRRSGSRYHGRR